ncbi:type IV secretion system DNA-binding domain-containing protein (plasmid) [Haloterrigena salifodinae]|uniref:Type IV secretion system DNA-binding domain-containing protein n=1 Tax=Haloterrigena salifodinae TaxID=2675099 RepID=A0A8T8E6C0_9EURY|nr:TraM recognition domain-containing protein [Haloterrigena salifodinae]QRV17424.1 type IV secretion system DNA-binding domain-containing protein [Haloterrigena salifodinae]
MVLDRFFDSDEESTDEETGIDDPGSTQQTGEQASDEILPAGASNSDKQATSDTVSEPRTQTRTTLETQYDIVDNETTKIGGQPIITETLEEGPVAGPFVRDMFEAGADSPQAPLWVGYTEDPQSGFREAPLRFDSLFRHVWIAGTTGYGKTTQLLNMMVQWAYAGHGFAYFDPKGQDSRELLRMLPEHRLEDVVWIEPGSTTHEKTVGLNFLEVPECETTEEYENEIENRVENLKAVFDTSDYWGINMEAITESMARAMMKSEKPFSVIDMYFTLLNAERREEFALDVEDPYIREFCLEIAQMDDETVRPLLKRIKSWVENTVVRRIIAHRESTIDFRDIIDNDRIVIVRTPVENTDIKKMVTLGVMRNLWSAIQRRSYELDSTPDPYFVLCDEFDDIASDNLDIESMLARARSMRLSVTLASQYPSQFDEETLKAMQNNCDNLLAFSVNDSDDAELLMKRFRDYTAEDLITTDQFKVWTKLPLTGGRYSEPVLLRTFPPYPPLRRADEVDRIIERSLERYGTDPVTDTEILRNLIYREHNEAASPDALTVDRVMADAIRAVQMRADVRDENGWVSVPAVDKEVIDRLETGEQGFDDTVDRDEFPDVRQESPLIDVDISVREDSVVVRLTDEGEKIAEPETGDVRAAGGDEHDALLLDLENTLTKHGFHVDIFEQDGSDQPDGTAVHPELDAVFALEAETTTPDRPAKVLQNLKRAQETDRTPLFVVRPGEDDLTRVAARVENILEPPVRELADGSVQFYNTDERITFGGGADSRGGVTAVRPATDSKRTVWTDHDSEWGLSDGDREFVRTAASADLSKDAVPAYYSYDRETDQYTVYGQGDTFVYESSDLFESEWMPVKRPFVPAHELPNPEYDRDSYTILILSHDGTAQFYREGKTMSVSDALETLIRADGSSDRTPEKVDSSMANEDQNATETDLELDPDDDGVGVFADRFVVTDDNASIPKAELYQAYSTWVAEHDLDGTNDVWFARKLGDHLEVDTERRRVGGERVNFYTSITLTEAGKQLLETANESE